MFSTIIVILQQFLFVSFIKTQAFKKQLTTQEENDYIEKYHSGDMSARNKLIEHNLRLVAHIAKKYERLKLNLWKEYEHNRNRYTDLKNEFVEKYTEKAKEEYGNIY